jgi:hypothetical protein
MPPSADKGDGKRESRDAMRAVLASCAKLRSLTVSQSKAKRLESLGIGGGCANRLGAQVRGRAVCMCIADCVVLCGAVLCCAVPGRLRQLKKECPLCAVGEAGPQLGLKPDQLVGGGSLQAAGRSARLLSASADLILVLFSATFNNLNLF